MCALKWKLRQSFVVQLGVCSVGINEATNIARGKNGEREKEGEMEQRAAYVRYMIPIL